MGVLGGVGWVMLRWGVSVFGGQESETSVGNFKCGFKGWKSGGLVLVK